MLTQIRLSVFMRSKLMANKKNVVLDVTHILIKKKKNNSSYSFNCIILFYLFLNKSNQSSKKNVLDSSQ